jgi:hypothetical protein
MNYLAQLFGLISLFLLIMSYQQTKKQKFLFIQIFANVFYFIQYILLSAFSAAASNMISIIRSSIFYKYEISNKKIPIFFLFIFEIIILIAGFITYVNIFSIIPIIIVISYTYATWQKNLKVTYFICLVAAILWILYNYVVGAYVSIIGSIIEFTASTIGFIKVSNTKNK